MQIIRATKSTRRYSKCNVCWTKMDTLVKSKVYWQIEGQQCREIPLPSGLAVKRIMDLGAAGCTMESASKEHCLCNIIYT